MWAITERFRHEAVKMIPSATRHAAQGFFECLHFIYAHAWSCSHIVNLWVHLYVHGYPGFDHIFAECFAHVNVLSQCWVTCWSAPMETGHAFILNSLTHAHDQLPVILYVEPSSLSICAEYKRQSSCSCSDDAIVIRFVVRRRGIRLPVDADVLQENYHDSAAVCVHVCLGL